MKIVIVGAGSVGRSIARELLQKSHRVLLIDRNATPERLARVEGAQWLEGDACELSVLHSAELESAEVVVAATGDDKVNLVVVRADLDYKGSLTSGDRFAVTVAYEAVSKVRFGFRQQVIRLADNKVVLEGLVIGTAIADTVMDGFDLWDDETAGGEHEAHGVADDQGFSGGDAMQDDGSFDMGGAQGQEAGFADSGFDGGGFDGGGFDMGGDFGGDF